VKTMTNRTFVGIVVLAWIGCAGAPALAQPSTDAVKAAWAGEDAYWRAQRTGDGAGFAVLFHARFTGWPCGSATTVSGGPTATPPGGVGVVTVLDQKAETGGAGYVQVYYRATSQLASPDGKTEKRVLNLTHLWVPDGGAWKIIGGMCREAPAPK
jgi:hypothetical protein